MSKRYELKIDYSDIQNKDDYKLVQELEKLHLDGTICIFGEAESSKNDTRLMHFDNAGYFEIKRSWLTEIKEPLTMQEAWEKYSAGTLPLAEQESFDGGWISCLENQKLGVVVDEEKDLNALKDFLENYEQLLPAEPSELWLAALKYARGL